jgi:hypothetical protein
MIRGYALAFPKPAAKKEKGKGKGKGKALRDGEAEGEGGEGEQAGPAPDRLTAALYQDFVVRTVIIARRLKAREGRASDRGTPPSPRGV